MKIAGVCLFDAGPSQQQPNWPAFHLPGCDSVFSRRSKCGVSSRMCASAVCESRFAIPNLAEVLCALEHV